ncbi:MAG: HD domain-containing protein [Crocinitomicaceae bacterium]
MISKIINTIEAELQETWAIEPTGHDWEHLRRVRDMALHLQSLEGGDRKIIHLGALLHDVSDHKFNGGKLNANGDVTNKWLTELNCPEEIKKKVCELVDKISFKGALVEQGKLSLETQIVQDADRLDAIGAIGIARAFAFGGNRNRPIFNQDLKPTLHDNFEEYSKSKSHTINHFYEKLLLLTAKMNTKSAKKIAEERHQLMENFLKSFYQEWNFTTLKQ